MYSLEKHHSRAGTMKIKPYGKNGPIFARSDNKQVTHERIRRLSLLWMREVKDCFVWKQDHLARQC